MKLRFKLILAFLLPSVVPLSGVIVYSYVNSQPAVRRAVESAAQMMADEMSLRLEGVRDPQAAAEASDDVTVLVAKVQESVREHPAELQRVHATIKYRCS